MLNITKYECLLISTTYVVNVFCCTACVHETTMPQKKDTQLCISRQAYDSIIALVGLSFQSLPAATTRLPLSCEEH